MNSTTEKVYVYGSTVLVLIFVSYPHLIFHTLSVRVVLILKKVLNFAGGAAKMFFRS